MPHRRPPYISVTRRACDTSRIKLSRACVDVQSAIACISRAHIRYPIVERAHLHHNRTLDRDLDRDAGNNPRTLRYVYNAHVRRPRLSLARVTHVIRRIVLDLGSTIRDVYVMRRVHLTLFGAWVRLQVNVNRCSSDGWP